MPKTNPTREWALYARISDDRKDGAGVDRQLERCLEVAAARGWVVPEHRQYIDNDVSASAFARRPRRSYIALVDAAKRGELAGVVVFKIDRLYRKPTDLEELIPTGLYIGCTDDGDCDLGTPSGQLMARMLAAVGANEVSSTSIRSRLQRKQLRDERGIASFVVPFGWKSPTECDPAEMALVRETAGRLVDGESLTSLTAEWNRRGLRTRRGGRWITKVLRGLLLNPRHAGLLAHHGEVVEDAVPAWRAANAEHLMPIELHRQVVALLGERTAAWSALERSPRRWLSGVLVCGRCGATLKRQVREAGRLAWVCHHDRVLGSCGKLSITLVATEAVVFEALMQYVDSVDLAAQVRGSRRGDAAAAADELGRVERVRSAVYHDHGEGLLSDVDRRRRLLELKAREDKARAQLDAARASTGVFGPYAGRRGVLREAWGALSEPERAELVRAAFGTIVVATTERRGRAAFDPARLSIAPVERAA